MFLPPPPLQVSISVPNTSPTSDFAYRVTGLLPSTTYYYSFDDACVRVNEGGGAAAAAVTTDQEGDSGSCSFYAPAGPLPCVLTLTLTQPSPNTL
jgi:hypothetical protein